MDVIETGRETGLCFGVRSVGRSVDRQETIKKGKVPQGTFPI